MRLDAEFADAQGNGAADALVAFLQDGGALVEQPAPVGAELGPGLQGALDELAFFGGRQVGGGLGIQE